VYDSRDGELLIKSGMLFQTLEDSTEDASLPMPTTRL